VSTIPSNSKPTRIVTMNRAEFAERFGCPDVRGELYGYTREDDTRVVLTVLVHVNPRRVLEVGTALGHMTANLTRWTGDDARVFTIGLIRGMSRAAPGAVDQQGEVPSHEDWGRFGNHFGTAYKAFFITADTMTYDFGRLAPLDFAFIDGAQDLEHVLNDSRKVYEALAPGGWMVEHDFNSPVPWVQVREAIESARLTAPVVYIEGTEVAFLRKGEASPGTGSASTSSEGSGVRVAGAESATPQDNGLGSRAPACLPGPHGAGQGTPVASVRSANLLHSHPGRAPASPSPPLPPPSQGGD